MLNYFEINSFLTQDYLGTFHGAIIAVTILTQILKKYINTDPKWVALLLSFLIVFVFKIELANFFSIVGFVETILNSFLVTGVSIGVFETAKTAIRSFKNNI
ncbi:MAG: hypothetical protein FWC91_05625 [Defluviitaleaceae bacterium]|nr:hypothetical protein [Defluviitaleaceae bacterium]